MFPPGMLNKHFVRLISFDRRLFELSRKSFPTHEMPFFYEQQRRPNIVYEQNQFTMTTSNNQILRLPHRLPQHLTQFSIRQSDCVRLPPSSKFRPKIRTPGRMNNNYFHWRSVTEEIVDDGNRSIIGRGSLMVVSDNDDYRTFHNVELMMSNPSNNNNPPNRSSQHYSVQGSSRGFNSSNRTTDGNRLRRPPPP